MLNFLKFLKNSPVRPSKTRNLFKREIHIIQTTGCCPYCGCDLYEGPSAHGGANLYCGNVDTCNSGFNISPVLPWGEFIGGVPSGFKTAMTRKD